MISNTHNVYQTDTVFLICFEKTFQYFPYDEYQLDQSVSHDPSVGDKPINPNDRSEDERETHPSQVESLKCLGLR